jgi:hypothetical protein
MIMFTKMHFKIYVLSGIFMLLTILSFAQVGIGTSSPAGSAQLEVSSTTKGFLPPRMTYAQRQAISAPVAGLMIWCSNCGTGEIQVHNGVNWTNMIGGSTSSVLAVGDNYGGGVIAYILQSGDPGYAAGSTHGFIVSASDLSAASPWWNGVAYTTTNATGTAIGTGLANTNAIIASQGNTASYAAKLCADYSITVGTVVYDDWYFPSLDELNKIYLNKASIGGSFSTYYWSSSELSDTNARLQNFSNGVQSANWKDPAYAVRAIRSF